MSVWCMLFFEIRILFLWAGSLAVNVHNNMFNECHYRVIPSCVSDESVKNLEIFCKERTSYYILDPPPNSALIKSMNEYYPVRKWVYLFRKSPSPAHPSMVAARLSVRSIPQQTPGPSGEPPPTTPRENFPRQKQTWTASRLSAPIWALQLRDPRCWEIKRSQGFFAKSCRGPRHVADNMRAQDTLQITCPGHVALTSPLTTSFETPRSPLVAFADLAAPRCLCQRRRSPCGNFPLRTASSSPPRAFGFDGFHLLSTSKKLNSPNFYSPEYPLQHLSNLWNLWRNIFYLIIISLSPYQWDDFRVYKALNLTHRLDLAIFTSSITTSTHVNHLIISFFFIPNFLPYQSQSACLKQRFVLIIINSVIEQSNLPCNFPPSHCLKRIEPPFIQSQNLTTEHHAKFDVKTCFPFTCESSPLLLWPCSGTGWA
ncbi:putative signal peptide protein [Puccinia sorghi]|uniref:Putative signal peptide protein n=1 Tax=Puccinia sorghi TaxID=27349 RepID=A0A0L6V6H2_9BASI|nr:putative signal peptide protein [Puccinia sorghi]